jgi:hypothetical protein
MSHRKVQDQLHARVFVRHTNRLFMLFKVIALFCIPISLTGSVIAQSSSAQSSLDGIVNLFGALAKAGAKSKAQKQWQAQDQQITQCINTIFAVKNIDTNSLIAAGIGPNDTRVAPILTLCNAVMTAQPNTNFPCNVTNAAGRDVSSICSESYATLRDGSLVPVSRDDFLRAFGNGEQVQVANFETTAAQNSRLSEERRMAIEDQRAAAALAEANRQKFLASPEGKRQAALRRQEEFERKQAAAKEVAQAARRPRGYKLVCLGNNNGERDYNRIFMNCETPSGVLQSLSSASVLMKDNGIESSYIENCKAAIVQARRWYAVLSSYENSKEYIEICNIGLARIKGPSYLQASRK